MLTEFFNTPDPVQTPAAMNERAGLRDATLAFGKMKMVQGRAFSTGQSRKNGTPTYKSWLNLNGRKFLVEQLPLSAMAGDLKALLATATSAGARNSTGNDVGVVSAKRLLPPPHEFSPSAHAIQTASIDSNQKPGLVLDYSIVGFDDMDVTFSGDSTWYVSDAEYLDGTVTFEGGTVIKYAPGAALYIDADSEIKDSAAAYRPVIFTAMDDDTAGETIGGSTGTPTGYYADPALSEDSALYQAFSNLRISYAYQALEIIGNHDGVFFYDMQLVNCSNGVKTSGASVYFYNVLFADVGRCFNEGDSSRIDVQNGTFCNAAYLTWATSSGFEFNATNCIFAGVDDLEYSLDDYTVISGDHNGFTHSPAFGANTVSAANPFQTVGTGSYYLADGSAYHNAGTPVIDPAWQAELQRKTTHPPLVYSNEIFSADQNFNPQAARDTGAAPDLGYHYDPLDYVFIGCQVQASLTFTASTAAGWYVGSDAGGAADAAGLICSSNATVTFDGTATAPCWWTRYSNVQEGNGNWPVQNLHNDGAGIMAYNSGAFDLQNSAHITARFTRFAGTPAFDKIVQSWWPLVFTATDCEFYHGNCRDNYTTFALTNCLVFRCVLGDFVGRTNYPGLFLRNCTLIGGVLTEYHLSPYTNWPVWIENCAFDGTDLHSDVHDYSGGNTNVTYCDYNAFLTNADRLPMHGAHDVTNLVSFNWQEGVLGGFYLPTNSLLINAGSRSAADAGLDAYTTQTSQNNDSGTVDIGYHYPVLTPPTAYDAPYEQTCQNTPLDVPLNNYASDSYGLPLTYIIVTPPAYGTLSNAGSGHFIYTPGSGFTGTDTFTFKVNDGFLDSNTATATITVGDQNIVPLYAYQLLMTGTNQPLSISLAASSPLNCTNPFAYTIVDPPADGTLTGSGANRTYTPDTDFEGPDQFTCYVSDGVWSNSCVIYIYVAAGQQLTAVSTGGSAILLGWSLDAELDYWLSPQNWEIYRSTMPGVFTTNDLVYSGSITYTYPSFQITYLDHSATPGDVYYYEVRFDYEDIGNDVEGIHPIMAVESPWSNVAAVTNDCPADTDHALWVNYGPTPQQMAQWIMGTNPVMVMNATYTGAQVAKGIFGNGSGVGLPTGAPGLPIDAGVILANGPITNAIGPNDDNGGGAARNSLSNLGQPGDVDLNNLVGDSGTEDAAVLEFDIVATNSFTLRFQYIYASEEYPEWIGSYNDPMAIFVSTNFDGTNWVNSITNDIALVPGTTNVPVSVRTINGGCVSDYYGNYDSPTNVQYYVDNDDPYYSAATNAAASPVYNLQYDGFTTLLTAQVVISANVTNHVKIAIADDANYVGDADYDSAVFIKAQTPCN
jgi:hypothetical protein